MERGIRGFLGAAVVVLGGYALLVWAGASRVSATYDEPLHLASASAVRSAGDLRANPEDPALFKRYVALFAPDLPPDATSRPGWGRMLSDFRAQWDWAITTSFGPGGADPAGASRLEAARRWMVLPAAATVAAVGALAWWLARGPTGGRAGNRSADRSGASHQAPLLVERPAGGSGVGAAGGARAGAVAALLAVAVVMFDPAFLGHGPLVKNDVTATLWFVLAAWLLAATGVRATLPRVVLLGAVVGAAATTKFSGVLLGPIVVAVLLGRAVMPHAWPAAMGVVAATRWRRVGVAAGASVLAAVVAWGTLWAAYGLRFAASPEPGARMDFAPLLRTAAANAFYADRWDEPPTAANLEAAPVPAAVRLAGALAEHRVVPEAWAYGFAYTHATTRARWGFLAGELSPHGWRGYFPYVLAVKLPAGTWAVLLLAAGIAVAAFRARRRAGGPADWAGAWPTIAVGGVALIYLMSAVTGSFNVGVRHVLPVLALVYAVAGATIARRVCPSLAAPVPASRPAAGAGVATNAPSTPGEGRTVPAGNDAGAGTPAGGVRPGMPRVRLLAGVATGCVMLTAAESLSRWPDSLGFFNLPAVAVAPPHHHLSDSNLDWGQTLVALRAWQLRHPDVPLTVHYFGPVAPEAYGVRAARLDPARLDAAAPGVLAVSATHLQAVYAPDNRRGQLGPLRRLRPVESLAGGAMLLYAWPPTEADLLPEDDQLHLTARVRGVTTRIGN